jgi:tripartite-type tricarboxylate transporter receptor subunit TctC
MPHLKEKPMRLNARRFAMIALTAAFSSAFPGVAMPQAYPSKPVRVIIPFAPGGPADIIARIVSQKLSVAMGQTFVAENRAGAGGMIGADVVAKSPADGYTVLVTSLPFTITPSLYSKVPYNTTRDFIPITLIASGPMMLVTHPSVPAMNLKELIALAKARPGSLNYGSAGSGSSAHMATEYFTMLAGVKMTHVPYKGGGPAMTDLLGGQLSLLIEAMPLVLPYVKQGLVRAIAISGTKRAPSLPDTPTFEEQGLRGYEMATWTGMWVPADTPKDVVARLHREVVKAIALPDVRERFAELGVEGVGDTPEHFAAFAQAEIEKWGKVVRETGMRVE